jgi:hypothetical protein
MKHISLIVLSLGLWAMTSLAESVLNAFLITYKITPHPVIGWTLDFKLHFLPIFLLVAFYAWYFWKPKNEKPSPTDFIGLVIGVSFLLIVWYSLPILPYYLVIGSRP